MSTGPVAVPVAVVPVAVVVPTVARPAELARCLDAVLSGEALPSRVVVVDQGGDPGTVTVLAERAGRGVPLTHVRSPRRGLSAARNTGLRQVSEAWVAFTDDDCVPTAGWLAAIHRRVAVGDVDGVAGRVLPLGEPAPETFTLSLRVSQEPAVHRGRALPWVVGTGGNMALRVDVLRDVGGYDERLGAGTPGLAGEDLEVVHRLLRRGAVLAYDPDVLVEHGRVPWERRLATRYGYGFGMGAFVGLWLRADPWVAWTWARWAGLRVRETAGALRRRNRRGLREQGRLVRGLLAGTLFGLRVSGGPVRADPAAHSPGARSAPAHDPGVHVEHL